MITIKFIAQKAGVSIATVSRVLNKSKYVSPDIEKRVMEVVEKYHYRPNSTAQALASKCSHTLGIIFSNKINMFQSICIQFICQFASSSGYSVINTICEEDFENRLEALQMLQDRHTDAILCTFEFLPEELIKIYDIIKTPFLSVGINDTRGDVYILEENAAFHAVKYLIELGHTKIGGIFPNFPERREFITGRYDGFIRALDTYHIPVEEKYIYRDVMELADVAKSLSVRMDKQDHPTAFFCYSDEVAIGAMLYLAQEGFRIPQDISLMGFDAIPLSDMINPRLTTVDYEIEDMCKRIVENMICLAEGKKYQEPQNYKEYSLKIRESCCPPAESL